METLSLRSTTEDTLATHWSARALAFYLPQFHPIPENNAWWGPGFTEWTNTAKARPLFRGHKQPHLPADLGFYDLRLAETRQAQAELARTYGVEAFVYWHYWFAGRRILERPFEEMLRSGEPDQGFCLAWANQSWTGAWHGAHDRILIEQTYPGPQDEEAHFEYLLPAFQDARYFRVNGVPLFYIFRPEQLPDAQAFARRWREMAVAAGLGGLYLVGEISDLLGKGPISGPPESYGFDAGVYMRLPAKITPWTRWRMRICRKALGWPETYDCLETPPVAPGSYRADNIHPCLYSNWDNTPRANRRGLVLRGTSPAVFRAHVSATAHRLQARPWQERLLFIKSWNEWAEGNYLEPDIEYGHEFLKALSDGLSA